MNKREIHCHFDRYQVCEAFGYKLLQSELWSRPLDDTVKIVFIAKFKICYISRSPTYKAQE